MKGEGFPLEELAKRASEALFGVEQASARVREQIEARTIRYYTSLGLLDKPLYFQGRTAFYGDKHLAQLVAVKRLQAQGLSLQEVQRRLLGISEEGLYSLSGLPRPRADAVQIPTRRAFWKEPAPPVKTAPVITATSVQKIQLSPQATLLLESLRAPLEEKELAALQEAAAPLLRYLENRGRDREKAATGDRGPGTGYEP